MFRLKITFLTFFIGLLMPQLSSAQLFTWQASNNAITQGTPVVKTTTVSDVGVLNSVEGKSPIAVVNITHTYAGDIEISLTSPEGTTIDLTSDNGGSGDDYSVTVFSNTASASITSGTAPFNGHYMPEESFALFDGENADGVWTMTITDNGIGDDGTFIGGQLVFRDRQFFSYGLDNSSLDNDGSSGNNLVLPSSGVTWTENIHNQPISALEFDGTGFAEATEVATPTNAVTVAAWVKPSNIGSDVKVINLIDNSNFVDLVSLGIYNGEADFEVKEDSGSGRVTAGAIADGKWTHIAGVWSSADNLMRLYVNGILVGTALGPGGLSFVSAGPQFVPVIGAAGWDPSILRYTGAMDDVRAYGVALSNYQIKDIVANYNQYCSTAIDLVVTPNTCDASYYAHSFGGNGVNGPSTSCGGNAGGASWFKITVPSSGDVTISSATVAGTTVTDNVIEAYSGSCGSLSYIDCSDDVNGNFAELALTNQTPGDVLYIKSWEYDGDSYGQYVMCAFDPSSTIGIEDNLANVEIQLYPNPASNQIQVVADLNKQEEVNLLVVNALGQVVLNESIGSTQGINQTMDVSALSNGSYFLRIQSKTQVYTKRFIVRK